jgi:sorting nexin-29
LSYLSVIVLSHSFESEIDFYVVLEMHGEMIEFNQHLLRAVQGKESVIQRMREELIDLRGPLPHDDADEDACSSVSGGNAVSVSAAGGEDNASLLSYSLPAARLLHIWIPSVFLSGTGSRTHHVYQVYLRIKDEEWNIYRRYSDFYALHRDLRSKEAIVATFDFPPKKPVGNKAEKFVEDRRKRLQNWLRNISRTIVAHNPSLSAKPDKASVVLILPFFGENSRATRSHSRSQSRSRSLFSRGRAASTASSAQLAL